MNIVSIVFAVCSALSFVALAVLLLLTQTKWFEKLENKMVFWAPRLLLLHVMFAGFFVISIIFEIVTK